MGTRIGWQRTWRTLMVGQIFLGLLVASVGCGSGGGDVAKPPVASAGAPHEHRDRFTYARTLFREICAGCHTLADASAHGQRFDLDTESPIATMFKSRDRKEALARYAITSGERDGGMPAWGDVLSRREVEALIAYVVAVAGKRSASP